MSTTLIGKKLPVEARNFWTVVSHSFMNPHRQLFAFYKPPLYNSLHYQTALFSMEKVIELNKFQKDLILELLETDYQLYQDRRESKQRLTKADKNAAKLMDELTEEFHYNDTLFIPITKEQEAYLEDLFEDHLAMLDEMKRTPPIPQGYEDDEMLIYQILDILKQTVPKLPS